MKLIKAAAIAGLAAGASLALGGPAMAATKPVPAKATLKAASSKVKVGKDIALSGKFTGAKKGETYTVVLGELGKDHKFHAIKSEKLGKNSTYTFDVLAAKTAGKETFEVAVVGTAKHKVVDHTLSKPVSVTVVKK